MLKYGDYIKDLNKINELLKYRKEKGLTNGVDLFLVEAAELACESLNRLLLESSFWDWMDKGGAAKSIHQESLHDFDRVIVPANTEVLHKIGYIGPPEPQELLYEARKAIEEGKAGKVEGNCGMVQTKIENLTSIVCGYAGRARGVLRALDNNRESVEQNQNRRKRLTDRFPTRKVIKAIIDTVTIISGVVTILGYAESKVQKKEEKPESPPVEIVEQHPEVEQFWRDYYMYGVPDEEEIPDATDSE